jgi:hypothetical protein
VAERRLLLGCWNKIEAGGHGAWRAFVHRVEMFLVEVEQNQDIELNVNGLTGCYVVILWVLGEARFPLYIS